MPRHVVVQGDPVHGRVGDKRRADLLVDILEQCLDEGGLAGSGLAHESNESTLRTNAVDQRREGFAMSRALIQE